MEGRPELYLCIRPKDPLMDRSTLKKRLHALDEDFTEHFPGGLGGYNFDKECSEVWLYDESLEAKARALIAKHGFEVREEEEIGIRK
jgi:hypothetical protein